MAKISEALAKNLTALRKKRGWSQEDLAEKMGVHRNSISRWESGDGGATLETIAKLAEVFNVEETDLVSDGQSSSYQAMLDIASALIGHIPEEVLDEARSRAFEIEPAKERGGDEKRMRFNVRVKKKSDKK